MPSVRLTLTISFALVFAWVGPAESGSPVPDGPTSARTGLANVNLKGLGPARRQARQKALRKCRRLPLGKQRHRCAVRIRKKYRRMGRRRDRRPPRPTPPTRIHEVLMTDTTTRPIQISYFIPAESLERDASGRIVAPEVPTTLAIKVGEAVRFIWDETNQRGSHTIAPAIFPSPVNRFDFSFMGAPAHGDISFQRTFTVPGFYEFVCGIHPETQILELTVNR